MNIFMNYEPLLKTEINVFGIDLIVILLSLVISYLLGSVNTSIVVSKLFSKSDIRKSGSGNAGMTNTMRVMGKKAGIIVVFGDMLKTIIAMLICGFIGGENAMIFAGLGVVLGHVFPLYFGFRGGKGVLTGVTIVLFADFRVGLISLLIFFILILITKMVSVGSVLATFFTPITYYIFNKEAILNLVIISIVSLLIIVKHRTNIIRIIKGEENKIGSNKNKKG